MRKVKITKNDEEFCKYAVMMKGDERINDYAVALFSNLEDAEDFICRHYTIRMTLNGDIYIAENEND